MTHKIAVIDSLPSIRTLRVASVRSNAVTHPCDSQAKLFRDEPVKALFSQNFCHRLKLYESEVADIPDEMLWYCHSSRKVFVSKFL